MWPVTDQSASREMANGSPKRKRLPLLAAEWTELDHEVAARVVEFPVPRLYRETLQRAQMASGLLEAVTTGLATIDGRRIVVASFEFGFLGGTLGVHTGAKIARALEYATDECLPFVFETASGGVRVQEGVPALLQMPRVAVAARRHREAGNLQIALLLDPTFGGVPAGFALAADVLITTPNARFGFTGSRIVDELVPGKPTEPSQTDQPVHPSGLADMEAPKEEHASLISSLLEVTSRIDETPMTRHGARPGLGGGHLVEVLECAADQVVELRSDRRGNGRSGVACGFARLDSHRFGWLALGTSVGSYRPRPGPGGYAKLTRHIELVDRLRLPLVSIIDVDGADSSPGAEAHNIAGEIALTTAAFATARVPTAALIMGNASSGGAMAVAGADLIVMDPRADFCVLPPRAAARLITGDPSTASSLVPWLRTSADALRRLGVADRVVSLDSSGLRGELGRFLQSPPKASQRKDRWSASDAI
jgi:acyl-CoA carboxylase subunit beta